MAGSITESVLSLEDAVAWRQELRSQNKKLVVTDGCFDGLQRGHIEFLNESIVFGDAMLILVKSDAVVRALKGDNNPVNAAGKRAVALCRLKSVDKAVIFDSADCHNEITALKPDIYVKGGNHTLETLNKLERNALLESGTVICFKPFVKVASSDNIVKKAQKNLKIKDCIK